MTTLKEPTLLQDATEQKLLEAACQVFAEKGRAATVREIVACAGLKNVAAINYYFGDKDKLYQAALRHALKFRLQSMELPAWPAETHPAVKLRDLIDLVVHRMLIQHSPWHLQLLMREMADPSDMGQAVIGDFIRPVYDKFWEVIREFPPVTRALLPDFTKEEIVHSIAFNIAGMCFYRKAAPSVIRAVVGEAEADSYTPDRISRVITDFSLRAVGVDPNLLVPPGQSQG